MAIKTLASINLKNKRVILRVDYNVPINAGTITDNKRIVASIPTIKYLLSQKCSIVLLSHLSRVEKLEDVSSGKKSLLPAFNELKKLLPKVSIKFVNQSVGTLVDNAVKELKLGEILMLENVRYNDIDSSGNTTKRESKNDASLGAYWASLGEVFINDAFGVCHRAAASNVGIANNIKVSAFGKLMELELSNLSKITQNPKKPVVAILGGSKISDKLAIIEQLLNSVDNILICGGMANTFLAAQNYALGNSLVEKEMIATAKKILSSKNAKKIILPVDFYVASEFKDQKPIPKTLKDKFDNSMILDIGKETISKFSVIISKAKTIFWNGPAGVFEFKNFQYGTREICNMLKKVTKAGTFTLIGGGDSASAAVNMGFKESDFSFISTGGGASLEYIEGKKLPGVVCIK